MLAMRACRSSVMIGAALDRRKMRRALDNLASLDAPWNCPHGRPTMRHLADLRTVSRGLGRAGWRKRGGKGGGGIGGW
jgi:DNA mismatch repair protein PMS2